MNGQNNKPGLEYQKRAPSVRRGVDSLLRPPAPVHPPPLCSPPPPRLASTPSAPHAPPSTPHAPHAAPSALSCRLGPPVGSLLLLGRQSDFTQGCHSAEAQPWQRWSIFIRRGGVYQLSPLFQAFPVVGSPLEKHKTLPPGPSSDAFVN